MIGQNLLINMKNGEYVGKFWFSYDMPDELKKICKPLLVKNEHLIPEWCHEVRVYWDAVGHGTERGDVAVAYIETNYAYRFACMTICPPFFSEEPQEQENKLRHELWHIVSAPLINYIHNVVEMVSKGDEAFANVIGLGCEEKIESLTEDLTNILVKIEENKKK